MSEQKYACENCLWDGLVCDLLSAPNPFEAGEMLYACPNCQAMEVEAICDAVDCWRPVTCGTPTANGYRHTCLEHKP